MLKIDDETCRLFQSAAELAGRGVDVRGLVWRSHLDQVGMNERENQHVGERANEAGAMVLLDERVRFLQGDPGDTLRAAPIERVGLVRIGPSSPADVWQAKEEAGVLEEGEEQMIHRVFGFAEARAAYDHLASGKHFGKVVIRF